MSSIPLLACEALGVSYQGRSVFHSLTYSFGTGVYALRGANGIGKSTLLRLLAGAQPADAGRVWIGGIDLMRAPQPAKRLLSYVPDENPVYPFMTGHELLEFVASIKRVPIDGMTQELISAFRLTSHLDTRFDAMSLGTQKKFLLCAAWIGTPKVLLLDEPSNGLDHASRDRLIKLLSDRGRENAVLFSTHDEDFATSCQAVVIDMQHLLENQPGPGERSGQHAA